MMVVGSLYFLTWESIFDAFNTVRMGATMLLSHMYMEIVLVLFEYRYVRTTAPAPAGCLTGLLGCTFSPSSDGQLGRLSRFESEGSESRTLTLLGGARQSSDLF